MLNITIARNRLLFRYRAAVASAGRDETGGTTADLRRRFVALDPVSVVGAPRHR